ncbi:glucose 1-dehydrogenase [Nocardioides sp. GY 10127]|uniref:glucose 1-dehydrogenase n=1 Tax=Nocardioides sp. GY 10127 TaxID=2569762 RepID=UPI0010A77914|nr:glucose 1-dehydrogenase [Nocardioides sp. GY 10127]TIC80233.1 glucose 1-dehydrogenase [Nocardioides sp. GY 10127]
MEGRAGVVTGAAGGIGRACALGYAEAGARVVVSDLAARRDEGEETVRLVREAGGEALFVAADVASEADQEALVAACVQAWGTLDYALNNAGVEHQASLVEMEEKDFDRVLEINLKGVWLGLKHQLRQMRLQGHGAIVNTSSLAGLVSPPLLGAYVASKHGVVGLTKTAAVENADLEIRVNAICPASIRTPLMDVLTPDQLELWVSRMAIKRLGEPSEVADVAVWLSSDKASFVTGVAVPVDAGASAM